MSPEHSLWDITVITKLEIIRNNFKGHLVFFYVLLCYLNDIKPTLECQLAMDLQ